VFLFVGAYLQVRPSSDILLPSLHFTRHCGQPQFTRHREQSLFTRHCERSEAIYPRTSRQDCRALRARNDIFQYVIARSSFYSSSRGRRPWRSNRLPRFARNDNVPYSEMIPLLTAVITACVRALASSLRRMEVTWFLMVCSLMSSWTAICLLSWPLAM